MYEETDLSDVQEALEVVRAAIAKAVAVLPARVQHQHKIQANISPSPWADVAQWWERRADMRQGGETAALLNHLAWLAEEREKLRGILTQAEAAKRPIDLRLPRVRRTA